VRTQDTVGEQHRHLGEVNRLETTQSVTPPAGRWHLITCEYPPQLGGVSDYTSLIAEGLARCGDEVHVWCPQTKGNCGSEGVAAHDTLAGATIPDLWRLGKALGNFAGARRRLLVQWVPHGYGFRSMNLAFCIWLWCRAALHRDEVDIVVHEPYLAFGEGSWRQNMVAIVHRMMTMTLLRAASRVWVSIPAWETCWLPYTLGRRVPFCWLPVPSNVPVVAQPKSIARVRHSCLLQEGQLLVGYFGIHSSGITKQLEEIIPLVLERCPAAVIVLMGKGSEECRAALAAKLPQFSRRIRAAGILALSDLSEHLAACDVMLQPYPDGISTRRTTAMAALAHGVPLVTTTGPLTEDFWLNCGAVTIAPAGNAQALADAACRLLADASERQRIGALARCLYDQRFDVRHVIAVLRQTSHRS
jgi:glycosyltransferase involved in cell wall biosynthesis